MDNQLGAKRSHLPFGKLLLSLGLVIPICLAIYYGMSLYYLWMYPQESGLEKCASAQEAKIMYGEPDDRLTLPDGQKIIIYNSVTWEHKEIALLLHLDGAGKIVARHALTGHSKNGSLYIPTPQ